MQYNFIPPDIFYEIFSRVTARRDLEYVCLICRNAALAAQRLFYDTHELQIQSNIYFCWYFWTSRKALLWTSREGEPECVNSIYKILNQPRDGYSIYMAVGSGLFTIEYVSKNYIKLCSKFTTKKDNHTITKERFPTSSYLIDYIRSISSRHN